MPPITITLPKDLLAYCEWYALTYGCTTEEAIVHSIQEHIDDVRYHGVRAEMSHE